MENKDKEIFEILINKTSVINLVKNTKNVYEYNKETLNALLSEEEYNKVKKWINNNYK